MLWSKSSDGIISLKIEPRAMAKQQIDTNLPSELEQIVCKSIPEASIYLDAHKEIMIQNQINMTRETFEKEVSETLEFFPKLGVAYAVSKRYHEINWNEVEEGTDADYLKAKEMIRYADALFAIRKTSEAIEEYNKINKLYPDFYDAWSNKGSALKSINRYEESLACYERALEIDPGSVIARGMKEHLIELMAKKEP